MSPIVLLVFAPVVLGGITLFALLLGSASAGAWEAVERRPTPRPPAPPRVVVPATTHARAA